MTTLATTSVSTSAAPVRDPALEPIAARVLAGERLTLAEGRVLYTTPDIWSVCGLADKVRRRLHGEDAFYNINRHMNYSNVCALSCKFCEFYRKRGEDGAYEHSIEDVRREARGAIESGATEMHIVGGLHPYLPFDYYTDMMRAIREEADALGSPLHIKAFTAVEIVHLAKIAKVYKRADRTAGIRHVLERLKEAGLGSLPGGGAEVFDDRIHDEAYKGKIRSDVWLDVHRVAHELGLNTNATILYGHIDQADERLVHMDMLRRAQDEALMRIGYEADGTGAVTLTREGVAQPRVGRCSGAGLAGTPNGLPRHGSESRATGSARHGSESCAAGSAHHGSESCAAGSAHHGSESCAAGSARHGSESCAAGSARHGSESRATGSGAVGGYFQTIIPLPFFPDGSELEHLPGPGGLENLRTLAVTRLMLDNFPHVKAFWIMQTLGMAQLMLQCGGDDIDGTVVWYDITKVGGASTHQETTVWDLQRAIREAGFRPVERDTLYRRVGREGKRWWLVD